MNRALCLAIFAIFLACGCNSVFDSSDEAMGSRYVQRGMLDKGIAHLDRGIQNSPSAYAYHYRALAYMQKNDYPKMLADAKSSLALDDNAEIRYLIGWIYMRMDKPQLAAKEFGKSVGKEPGKQEFLCAQAESFLASGDLPKAKEAASKALKLNPNDIYSRTIEAKAIYCAGDFKLAIDKLEQLLKENPAPASGKPAFWERMHDIWFRPSSRGWKCLGAEDQLAWILATCPEAKLRNPDKALILAKQAQSFLECSCIRDSLAAAYAAKGNFEEAKACEQKALALLRNEFGDGYAVYSAKLSERLERYKHGKPYVDNPADLARIMITR